MLSHNAEYYAVHGYGLEVSEYFTNYPIYFMVFWVENLLGGFISPIAFLMKKRWSCNLALISLISDVILIVLTVVCRYRINVLGVNVFLFDIFIALLTFVWYLYVKNILKSEKYG